MLEKIDCTDCGFFGFLVTFSGKCGKCRKSVHFTQTKNAKSIIRLCILFCFMPCGCEIQQTRKIQLSLFIRAVFTFHVSSVKVITRTNQNKCQRNYQPMRTQNKNKQTVSVGKRQTRMTKQRLVSILNLIGWGGVTKFLDQPQSKVKLNKKYPELLSTLNCSENCSNDGAM